MPLNGHSKGVPPHEPIWGIPLGGISLRSWRTEDLERISLAVNILYGNGNGKVAADGKASATQIPSLSGSGVLANPLLFRWDYQRWSQAP
jgi:hypothetical protein